MARFVEPRQLEIDQTEIAANEPPRGKPRGIRGGAVAQTQEFYPDYEHTF